MESNECRQGSVLGALIVGIIAGAVAVIYLDQDMRRKAQQKMAQLKQKSQERLNRTEQKATELEDQVRSWVADELSRAREKIAREEKK
jgi:uncharacterized membrane-anchored protein YhcB (DUF1043 family)